MFQLVEKREGKGEADKVEGVVDSILGEPATGSAVFSAIDYRERLSPEAFKVYSRLRDVRKRIAETEGVPVYTVFTNAQLAAISEKPVNTPEELESIDGVGKQRVERYGERILSVLGAGA